jgi:hypothetical protein
MGKISDFSRSSSGLMNSRVSDLAAVLFPMPVDDFFRNHFGREFVHIPSSPAKFADLLPWSAVNQILSYTPLDNPRLRLVREGQLLAPETFIRYRFNKYSGLSVPIPQISAHKLLTHLRGGATLIIDRVNELYRPISFLCSRLEHDFRVYIQANMYAGWCASPGFDLHWDEHDAMILQIAGRKHWKIYGYTMKFPVDRVVDARQPPTHPPIWEGILTSGDVLYLPRGVWHVALPCNEPTLHVTLGIHNPTALDIIRWLGDSLRIDELIRMDIPRFAMSEVKNSYVSAVREKIIQAFSDPDLLERFLGSLSDTAEPQPILGLPWIGSTVIPQDADDYVISLVTFRGMQVTHDSATGDAIVRFRGSSLVFPPAAKAFLDFLRAKSPIRLADFYTAFAKEYDEKSIVGFLQESFKWGLIGFYPALYNTRLQTSARAPESRSASDRQ